MSFIEAGVDAGYDVVAGTDLPLVPPHVDAVARQSRGELLGYGSVFRGIADENVKWLVDIVTIQESIMANLIAAFGPRERRAGESPLPSGGGV